MARITFLGGDARTITSAMLLSHENNAKCVMYGFDNAEIPEGIEKSESVSDAVSGSDAIVLPLPVTSDGIHINCPYAKENSLLLVTCLSIIKEKQLLLGGNVGNIPEIHKKTADYYEEEYPKAMMAIPTAEGAIAIALGEMGVTLYQSRTSVLGFGRIGKLLSAKLKALGSDVTVCARKEKDLALAESLGYNSVDISDIRYALSGFDAVFNTVPEIIIDGTKSSFLFPGTVFIELAGGVGGIKKEDADVIGVKYIKASGLPGKMFPVTAGGIVKDSIEKILVREGIL